MEVQLSQTGADLIAAFIAERCFPKAFLVTGGACAFTVDALGRNAQADYVCFQHEQSAAMAADAVWRTTGQVGITVSTSGPGATNLITGIACSWFDSIPSLHITGQVNQSESAEVLGVRVRQAGFQETDIVGMVGSITKFAEKVRSTSELAVLLPEALSIAKSPRMGPVLLDVPMDVQKGQVSEADWARAFESSQQSQGPDSLDCELGGFLAGADRPLVVIGAGTALAGTSRHVQSWCEASGVPYVASWGAMSYVDRAAPGYRGTLGVYGSRAANWHVQAADRILVLGSRLDNRQRTGNPSGFASFARLCVVDIDSEELAKYRDLGNYETIQADLATVRGLLGPELSNTSLSFWKLAVPQSSDLTDGTEASVNDGELSPYEAVRAIQSMIPDDAIVASDCGANLCWVYQAYGPHGSFLFTAGGNSPMGYSLPAAIGAQIANPARSVWCFIGDGGLQMNIQELQTVAELQLPIRIIVLNNEGYGIIKQFQDAYFEGRHEATGRGYSVPDFGKIAAAYGIPFEEVSTLSQIEGLKLKAGPLMVNVILPQGALITPKTEMDRFIHDQFPYQGNGAVRLLPFPYPSRPSQLGGTSSPTV